MEKEKRQLFWLIWIGGLLTGAAFIAFAEQDICWGILGAIFGIIFSLIGYLGADESWFNPKGEKK